MYNWELLSNSTVPFLLAKYNNKPTVCVWIIWKRVTYMGERSSYKTKQKENLLDYLAENEGKHITACDVCDHFKGMGIPIGQSTVYRQLERLVDEGILNKYTIDVNSPACFEYMNAKSHGEGEVCFHAKCEKCGKLIHLHCDEMIEISRHLAKEHNFTLDTKRTVLYGLCDKCRDEAI